MIAPERMTREDLIEEVAYLRGERQAALATETLATIAMAFSATRTEAAILSALYSAKGRTMTKVALLDAAYACSIDEQPEIKIIDVFICKLRAKVGRDAITTAWGIGYQLSQSGIARYESALAGDAPTVLGARPGIDTRRNGVSIRVAAELRRRPDSNAGEVAFALDLPRAQVVNGFNYLLSIECAAKTNRGYGARLSLTTKGRGWLIDRALTADAA